MKLKFSAVLAMLVALALSACGTPITSVAAPPVQLWTGQTAQDVITTKNPDFLGDKIVAVSSYVESSRGSGVMVPAGSSITAAKTGLQTAMGPFVAATAMLGSARIVSAGIVRGSDSIAGAVRDGLHETAGGLESVGSGLGANADAMTAMTQCYALVVPTAVAACLGRIGH